MKPVLVMLLTMMAVDVIAIAAAGLLGYDTLTNSLIGMFFMLMSATALTWYVNRES